MGKVLEKSLSLDQPLEEVLEFLEGSEVEPCHLDYENNEVPNWHKKRTEQNVYRYDSLI
jgi:hypothetical protein